MCFSQHDSTDIFFHLSDELATKVLQSKNFDIMRTVGFITILAAVKSSTLGCFCTVALAVLKGG